MASDILAAIAALGSIIACLLLLLVLRRAHDAERLRVLAEQGLAGQRAEGETTRAHLANAERALGGRLEQMRSDTQAALNALTLATTREQGEGRVLLEAKLREMADASALRLGEIQRSVNEQLHAAVEKQMETSFQRVLDQFAAVQKAMGDVARRRPRRSATSSASSATSSRAAAGGRRSCARCSTTSCPPAPTR